MTRLSQLKPSLRIQLDDQAYLRPVLSSDVTRAYVDGLNDPLVNRYLGQSRQRTQTVETVTTYIDANQQSPHNVLLGVFIDGGLRGTVRLHDVREDTCTATVGVLIFDKQYWRQMWASRAISAAVDFAVRELGIRRFQAGMFALNTASRITFARLGFRHRTELDTTGPENLALEYWQLDIPIQKPAKQSETGQPGIER